MKDRHKGAVLMAITAVMWSIGGVLVKFIPWHPVTIVGFRALITVGIIGLYMKIVKMRIVFTKRSITIGVILCANAFCYIIATKLTTAANAVVLQFTTPIYLLIYQAVFKKQKLRVADILVVVFTLGGISLFFIEQVGGGSLLGNCVALLSGMVFAGLLVTTAGVTEEVRLSGLFYGDIFAAIIGVPTYFVFDSPTTSPVILAVLILGVFQLGIPYIIYSKAAKLATPLTCSLISALEPLCNPIWVYLFIGENPGYWALIGGSIVIASVTIWCIWDGKQKEALELADEGSQAKTIV